MLVRLNDDPKVASEVDLKVSHLGMGGGMPLQDVVVTFQNSRVFQTSYL